MLLSVIGSVCLLGAVIWIVVHFFLDVWQEPFPLSMVHPGLPLLNARIELV